MRRLCRSPLVACALAAIVLGPAAAAADRPLAPGGRHSPEALLGFVAFNSPYLYGAVERHDGLTCQSCHDGHGPTGIAATFSFRVAPPSLRGIAQRAPRAGGRVFASVEAFARHAIEEEFDGPPADPRIIRALAVYLAGLRAPPPPATGDGSSAYRDEIVLDGRDAAAAAIERTAIDIAARDATLATFSLLTARHLLGEWAREAPSCAANAATASLALADIDDALIAGQWQAAVWRLTTASSPLQRPCTGTPSATSERETP